MRAQAKEWNIDLNNIGIMSFPPAQSTSPAAIFFDEFDKKVNVFRIAGRKCMEDFPHAPGL